MNKTGALALLVALVLYSANAQTRNESSKQRPSDGDDEVVKISSNLVQVDAVVTDKKGKIVKDLKLEDFEIYEDGKLQNITNFSFVDMETKPPVKSAYPLDKNAPPLPPASIKPDQIRRTIALVVDDLGLSFESSYFVKRALKKFVDEQMQPGDLVAIIRTAGGIGALQQFTTDKRQLYAAIERLKWYAGGRGGLGAFAPIDANMGGPVTARTKQSTKISSEEFDRFREDLFTVGTLGALNYVVRGLRTLPGRKSVLLLSDGLILFRSRGNSGSIGADRLLDGNYDDRVMVAMRQLTDLANRASVVIYTLDARGLQYVGLTAADDPGMLTPDQMMEAADKREADFFDSQSGLDYLARQTGGFPIRNSNDIAGGIRKVVADQQGYYLIGYRPDDTTFDASIGKRRFHKLSIKLKRPGLNVRTRTGFYGVPYEEFMPQRTGPTQLVGALMSPFSASDVNVRLTSLFGYDAKSGFVVRSFLHIKGSDLTFKDDADGWKEAVFDLLAVTFGDNGRIIDQVNKTHTMRVKGDVYKRMMSYGFDYVVTVPVKKAGAYQLRTVIRDKESLRIGSATQFIEIPDTKKDRIVLSGIVLEKVESNLKPGAMGNADGEVLSTPEDADSSPYIRRFMRGTTLSINYIAFNPKLEKGTNQARVLTQLRVFRDGKPVFEGKQMPLDTSKQEDPRRLGVGAGLRLGSEMVAGEYVLQVVVTDLLAKEKYRTATQWIDFEIVN